MTGVEPADKLCRFIPTHKIDGNICAGPIVFTTWSAEEAADGTNLYRHKDAIYFLPTEDEWVKAAYWNGTTMQTWATVDNSNPVAGMDSNYDNATGQPWTVGSGTEELNGTFDMMGNLWELTESAYLIGDYAADADRVIRGGGYFYIDLTLGSSYRTYNAPDNQNIIKTFRVASVPEPVTLVFLSCGSLALLRKRRPKAAANQ